MSLGLFYRSPCYVSGPWSWSYEFGTTWGWIINDRIFIFGWTIPLMMDLLFTITQLLSSQEILMDWSGVDHLWIIVMFLSAVWTHSVGTHSMQRIYWWANDAMLHFSKSIVMKKLTHLHLGWPEGEYIFSKCSFLGTQHANFAVCSALGLSWLFIWYGCQC